MNLSTRKPQATNTATLAMAIKSLLPQEDRGRNGRGGSFEITTC
jgi:hypothetical protein